MNEIHLYGVIGESVTAVDVKMALAKMDQQQPLIVRIDSEGGKVTDGLSMFEAFAAYPGPKKAIVQPAAFSIASYIAMAFDDVEIVSNGYVMIHNPLVETAGDAKALSQNVEMLSKMQASMTEAYSQKTGATPEVVAAWMNETTFFNAQEAVQMGFASRVIDTRAASAMLAPVALATKLRMPPQVYASLSVSDGLGGDNSETTQENGTMSNAAPVAATLQEIRAALPKAKSDFILKCLEQQLPIAQAQALAMEEMVRENEDVTAQNTELMAKLTAMESELTALKAQVGAQPGPDPNLNPEVETTVEYPMAKTGVRPVAAAGVVAGGKVSAKAQWDQAVRAELQHCSGNKMKAIQAADRANPGLRQQMLQEANAVA